MQLSASRSPSRSAAGLRSMFLGAATLISSCGPHEPREAQATPTRPDVIWIIVDTLRRDHLGCYGYARATSPAIDALARESVCFERAITSAPWTTPAIGGVLTSQAPSTLGLVHERMRLSAEWTTAAELFAAAGYRTAAVVSHSYCSSLQGFDQGFESFDESNIRGYADVSSPGVTARALEALQREDPRPLFLFVHYFDPHFAYLEHAQHSFGSPERYDGPIRSGQPYPDIEALRDRLSAADRARLLELYDSEIAFTDHYIGKLLHALRERSRWEQTIVALTADHGEAFGEHQTLGHGSTLFGEVIDVPLLLRIPKRAGERRAHPTSTLGLLPTCATLAGITDLPAMLGRDWLTDSVPSEPVFCETNQGSVLRAITDGSSKLIVDLAGSEARLFHLGLDPQERADRSSQHPTEVQRLSALLHDWLKVTTNPRFQPTEVQLSEAESERLRALGYLGGK